MIGGKRRLIGSILWPSANTGAREPTPAGHVPDILHSVSPSSWPIQIATPTAFLSDSMTAATTVLVCAGLGLLVATAVEGWLDPASVEHAAHGEVVVPAPRASVDADVEQEVHQ